MDTFNAAAIDPMALILSDRAYQIWLMIHHPHEPSVAELEQTLRRATPEDRSLAVARARKLIAYGRAVEEAAARVK